MTFTTTYELKKQKLALKNKVAYSKLHMVLWSAVAVYGWVLLGGGVVM